MAKESSNQTGTIGALEDEPGEWQRRRAGWRLFRKLFVYHAILAIVLVLLALLFPQVVDELPIGGVSVLAESGDLTVGQVEDVPAAIDDIEIVSSLIEATGELDRLGYARRLTMIVIGVLLLMVPVCWVQRGIHRSGLHDHSLDETTLILPGVVAAIVVVVQHSLALAFSLAGIIAGVQFRRALQDTFDALFILVAIGAGLAAGVEALEIAAILTVFFSYATLYVNFYGDGLESDYEARRRFLKKQRKEAAERAAAQAAEGEPRPMPRGEPED